MSSADIIGFFFDLLINPLFWLFIVFWIVYGVNKRRWAKITAIVFTVIGVLTFISTCDANFTHIIM